MMMQLVTALVTLSLVVTKVTDLVRNLIDKDDTLPKWLWNVVPVVIGVSFALGWQIDLTLAAFKLVPALANARLTGVAGQVLTGFVLGGLAGGGHEVLDWLSGLASNAHAKANGALVQLPPA